MNISGRPILALAAVAVILPLAACTAGAPTAGSVTADLADVPDAAPTPTAASTASTPLTFESPDGTPRLTVQITVAGGKTATVAVDTGSTGLFVDPDVVGSSVQTGTQTYTQKYLAGSMQSTLSTGTVEIAGVSTAAPITFGVVQSGDTADIFDGLDGIMGIAPADGEWSSSGLLSPIAQLTAPYNQGFQIAASSSGAGTLTVGVPPRPSGAITTPLTALAPAPTSPSDVKWWEKDIQLCWTLGSATQACGSTDLDSGAPSGIISSSVAGSLPTSGGVVQTGQALAVASPSGQQLWSFSTGTQKADDEFKVDSLGSETQYNAGLGFYLQHVVGFDWQAGELVVSPAS